MLNLFLPLALAANTLEDFHTGIFQPHKDEGLYQVEIGLEHPDIILAGFGYFNSDKYCDIIVLNASRDSAKIYLWDKSELLFKYKEGFQVRVAGKINSVIPGNFNNDGQLDLQVTWSMGDKQNSQIFYQDDEKFESDGPKWDVDFGTHPAAMDITGEEQLDVIYSMDGVGKIQTLRNGEYVQLDLKQEIVNKSPVCQAPLTESDIKISNPHSISYVDLNKDCIADIFITRTLNGKLYFTVYLGTDDLGYCEAMNEEAPVGAQQVSFVDIDRNGLEDLVFPVCLGVDCKEKQEIHIVYNDNENSDSCTFSKKKVSPVHFVINDIFSPISTKRKVVIQLENKMRFYSYSQDYPIQLQFGDLNLNGYPDMMFLAQAEKGYGYPVVFMNHDCDEDCGESDRRFFEINNTDDFKDLQQENQAIIATFFDLDENGIEDIILTVAEGNTFKVKAFYNNALTDAFRLKVLCLNGYGKQEYSTVYPGAVFMFTITELDMNRVQFHSTQMPTSGYNRLGRPYNIYGIGRTNSYIEELYVAMPRRRDNTKVWSPIIPNSYLIISPDDSDPELWFLELFANPTDKIGLIIIISVGCLIIIGGIVLWRYNKERREDSRENQIYIR